MNNELPSIKRSYDSDRSLSKAANDYLRNALQDHPWLTNPITLGAVGGLGGAALGRYVASPILSRVFGLDPERANRTMMLTGGIAGLMPAILTAIARKKLKGSYFASGGGPTNDVDKWNYRRYQLGNPDPGSQSYIDANLGSLRSPSLKKPFEFTFPVKSSSLNPRIYDEALWRPNFPVAQSLDDVANNPMIPPAQKITMRQLIAQAGREQGIGDTGTASAGALMAALPKVVSTAIPTVGGAWAASKMLGAPPKLKNTAIGGALVYSALKGFMSKDSAVKFGRYFKDKNYTTVAGRIATDNHKASQWYHRALKAALSRPFEDVRLSLPMQEHQWFPDQKREVELMENAIKSSSMKKDLPDGYAVVEEEDENGGNTWRRRAIKYGDKKVAFLTENPMGDEVEVFGVYTTPKHRGKGLARYLLSLSSDRNKGRSMKLAVKAFKDRPLDDDMLTKFYESVGFRSVGGDNEMRKDN